jgi:YD repeat-containing protein
MYFLHLIIFFALLAGREYSIISYKHDVQGRITQQTEKANANSIGLVTKYSYGILGNLLTMTDSRNRVTTMTYDVVNRIDTRH